MAQNRRIPESFFSSIADSSNYPFSILDREKFGYHFLTEGKTRLAEREEARDLFVSNERVYIPYREVGRDGKVRNKNLLSDADVEEELQTGFRRDSANPELVEACREDPAYTAICFITSGSTAPLETTSESLKRILTYFQVMPGILDFLYVFGDRHGTERELRFSGFRTDVVLGPRPGLVVDGLNRSGQRYQICYTLKGIDLKAQAPNAVRDKTWKIRHAAFHHQFDVVKGTQLWILGDQKHALRDLTGLHLNDKLDYPHKFSTLGESFKTSLDMHLIYCRWAAHDWRWHINSLEEVCHKITIDILDIEERDHLRWEASGLVVIQGEEEAVNRTIMVLESNAEIMTKLRDFYLDLVEDPDLPVDLGRREFCRRAARMFTSQVNELIYDLKTQTLRAQALSKLITDRKNILIQHLQAQAAARQDDFASTMWKQAERGGLEAAAVRIIAVITLVFLPATFVATFFSTDVVKYQIDVGAPDAPRERRSWLALARFFQVSVPLMVTTFAIAFWWYKREQKRRREEMEEVMEKYPDLSPSRSATLTSAAPAERGRYPTWFRFWSRPEDKLDAEEKGAVP